MDAFKKNTSSALQSLSLSHIPLTTDLIEGLLPTLPPLTHLSLTYCQLGHATIARFFQLLSQATSITHSLRSLDIAGNVLGQEGSLAMATWLKDCRPPALRSLGLANTHPDWSGIILALQKQEEGLDKLSISHNGIDEKVFQVLNPFIAHGHVAQLEVGALKGEMTMVEGLCGSLLLNTSLQAISLTIDYTPMDCTK